MRQDRIGHRLEQVRERSKGQLRRRADRTTGEHRDPEPRRPRGHLLPHGGLPGGARAAGGMRRLKAKARLSSYLLTLEAYGDLSAASAIFHLYMRTRPC
jgi:hypothetical protein